MSLSFYLSNSYDALFSALLERKKSTSKRLAVVTPNSLTTLWLKMQFSEHNFSCHCIDFICLDEVEQYCTGVKNEVGFSYLHTMSKVLYLYEQDILSSGRRLSFKVPIQQSKYQKVLWQIYSGDSAPISDLDNVEEEKQIASSIRRTYQEKQQVLEASTRDVWLVCFGFSFIPSFFEKWLVENATNYILDVFLLSPCMMFWQDIISDKKIKSKKIELEQLSIPDIQRSELLSYLRERNRLLANFGSLFHNQARRVHDRHKEIYELYILPSWFENEENSARRPDAEAAFDYHKSRNLLSILQADILMLGGKREKEHFDTFCSSIHVVRAYTISEEVTEACTYIANRLSKSHKTHSPFQVALFVSDFELYKEHLKRVFSYYNITWKFFSEKSIEELEFFKAFAEIVLLCEKRVTRKELERLLDLSAVRKKLNVSPEEIELFRKKIAKNAFSWGLSKRWREKKLKELDIHDGAYIYSLSDTIENEKIEFFKDQDVYTSTQELFSIHVLSDYLERLSDTLYTLFEKEQTISKWAHDIQVFIRDYLECNEEEMVILSQVLSEMHKEDSTILSFCAFISLMNKACSRTYLQQINIRNLVHVWVFSDFSHITLPFKTLVALGMHEGGFPSEKNIAEPPYGLGFDEYARHGFLQAVLCVKESLYLSYLGYSFDEESYLLPSRAIQEILDTVDDIVEIHGKKPSHFIVRSCEKKKEVDKEYTLPQFVITAIQSEYKRAKLTLRDVRKVLFYPLETYFEAQVDETIAKWDIQRDIDADILNNKALFNQIHIQGLQEQHSLNIQEIIGKKFQSASPLIQKAFAFECEKSREDDIEFLQKHINDALYSITLVDNEITSQKKHTYTLVHNSSEGKIDIIGTLALVAKSSHIVLGKKDPYVFWRSLGEIAVRQSLYAEPYLHKPKNMIFLREHRIEAYPENADEILAVLIEYIIEAHKKPLILYPTLIRDLLDNKDFDIAYLKEMQKKCHSALFSRIVNENEQFVHAIWNDSKLWAQKLLSPFFSKTKKIGMPL